MRRLLLALTIALLFVGAPMRASDSLLHADDFLLRFFTDYLEALRIQAGIPGLSATIVGENDTIWEHAFGQQNVERSIATRLDTPFHLDGLTQVVTASMVLRCVEEGRLSLDDRIGQFDSGSPDANATIRQVLTHSSGTSDSLVFTYAPERLEPLASAVSACTGDSYRETLANLLDRLAMTDSVPGPDAIHVVPPAEGFPDLSAIERYTGVLGRLATPYAVSRGRSATPTQYAATTLTPASGLISTVRDFARFDLALKNGLLLRTDTLAAAWQAPVGRNGQPLPHGLGWFVQTYNGETVVWQFGVSENASSSLVVTVPARGLTLVLLANSDGLVKPFALAAGDLTVSPVGRLFLGLFVR
jgi:CubicO group peptidase (beta-lactamase class C family)